MILKYVLVIALILFLMGRTDAAISLIRIYSRVVFTIFVIIVVLFILVFGGTAHRISQTGTNPVSFTQEEKADVWEHSKQQQRTNPPQPDQE